MVSPVDCDCPSGFEGFVSGSRQTVAGVSHGQCWSFVQVFAGRDGRGAVHSGAWVRAMETPGPGPLRLADLKPTQTLMNHQAHGTGLSHHRH